MYSQIALSSSTTSTRTEESGLDMQGFPGAVPRAGRAGPGEGADRREMVGARGFEPPTSRSRTVRATRLRYAPLVVQAGRNLDASINSVKHLPTHNLVHVRESSACP